MSSSTISLLNYIVQELTLYSGMFTLFGGVIGELLNVVVFVSLRTFRENSCALYLTVMSIMNIGRLLAGLLNRVTVVGFNVDWTQSSLIYCKFRLYCVEVCELAALSCICLAAIDQYFSTCSRPRWQQWSNTKLARRLSITIVAFWIIYGIPYPVYYNQIFSSTTNTVTCTSTNANFLDYHIYVNVLGLGKLCPAIITFVFGLLSYNNVKDIAHRTVPLVRRELDKQLTVMVLVQCLFLVCTVIPFISMYLITTLSSFAQDSLTSAGLQLGYNIALCLFYLNFASPFYIYFCASNRFRRQLKHVLLGYGLRPQEIRMNQIASLPKVTSNNHQRDREN